MALWRSDGNRHKCQEIFHLLGAETNDFVALGGEGVAASALTDGRMTGERRYKAHLIVLI